MSSNGLERLIIDMKESLEREIHALRDEMRTRFAEVTTRFDTQAARLGNLERGKQSNGG